MAIVQELKSEQRQQSTLQHFCEVNVAFSFCMWGNTTSDGEDEGVKIEVCPMKMGIWIIRTTLKNRRAAFYKELRVSVMTDSLAYREEWVMEVMPAAWIFE